MVAVCPGFKVTGVVIPVAPNSEPATEIEEIVTGAEPEEVRVTDCFPVVPTATFPNDTDVVFKVSAGTLAGESATENVWLIPPAWPVIVAVCGVVTLATVALNVAVVAPDLTVTLAGTVTAVLLLCSVTLTLLLAVDARYTVQASVPGVLYALLLHEMRLRRGVDEAATDDASRKRNVRVLARLLRNTPEIRPE
jgi:hypothetical protein